MLVAKLCIFSIFLNHLNDILLIYKVFYIYIIIIIRLEVKGQRERVIVHTCNSTDAFWSLSDLLLVDVVSQ